MKPFHKYEIPFVGLKKGKHQFAYSIDEIFFEKFEHAPIEKSKIAVELTFEKANVFVLDFDIKGTIETNCDRCSELVDFPIQADNRIFVKFNDELAGSGEFEREDIVYLSSNETHLNVAKLIYEFIVLSLPIRKTHSDDADGQPGCELKWENKEEQNKEKEADPRWEALKKLKKK